MQQQVSSVAVGYQCASVAFEDLFVSLCLYVAVHSLDSDISAPVDAALLFKIKLLQCFKLCI